MTQDTERQTWKIPKDVNIYIYFIIRHVITYKKQLLVSSVNMVSSLLTLPVELVYRILDDLDVKTIFLSLINVCTRFNTIIDIRWISALFLNLVYHHLRNIVHFKTKKPYPFIPSSVQLNVKSNQKIILYRIRSFVGQPIMNILQVIHLFSYRHWPRLSLTRTISVRKGHNIWFEYCTTTP